VVDLVNQLNAEKREGRAGRLTARLLHQDAIVLDELGYHRSRRTATRCCST